MDSKTAKQMLLDIKAECTNNITSNTGCTKCNFYSGLEGISTCGFANLYNKNDPLPKLWDVDNMPNLN